MSNSDTPHTHARTVRGGRMTKWKGRAASLSPSLSALGSSVSALGRALGAGFGRAMATAALASAAILITASNADANCVETATGSGVFTCSGSATTTQALSATGTVLDVDLDKTASVAALSGNGFTLIGDSGINFDQAAGGGSISGSDGINALNAAADTAGTTGALSITTTGPVIGFNNTGIEARNFGTDLTIHAGGDVAGEDDGIDANNYGSGALSITTIGSVTSFEDNDTGISAFNSTNGTNLIIDTKGAINAYEEGIYARNYGSGALSITTIGNVTSMDNDGIEADNRGTSLTIDTRGAINARLSGIDAVNTGSGALSITTSGSITSLDGDGIDANNGNTGTNLTIDARARIIADDNGIVATNNGTGALSITTSAVVIGRRIDGIDATTNGSGLTIDARGDISGNVRGIDARNNGSGALLITTMGTVTGKTDQGISAFTTGTNLIVTADGDVTGQTDGVFTENVGDGALSITTRGVVTGAVGRGIYAQNVVDSTDLSITAKDNVTGQTDGIRALNVNNGAVSITTTGVVTGETKAGISAFNTGADMAIIAGNDVTGQTDGIYAADGGAGGALSITTSGVAGGEDGIYIRKTSSGDLSVTMTGAVSGGDRGVFNSEGSRGGTFTITSTGSLSGGTGPALWDKSYAGGSDTNFGAASSTLNVHGALNGNALMERGSDAVNVFSSATLADRVVLDGGDDLSSVDGQIDTLTFSGFEGAVYGKDLKNWEQIVVADGATLSFSSDSTDVEVQAGDFGEAGMGLITQTGGTVQAFDGLGVRGNLLNSGRLTMQDGDADDSVTVTGDFGGGGAVLMDADLADETADRLTINGTATGTTTLFVSNIGGPATQDGADIDLVRVSGAAAENAFVLAAPVEGGAFAYDLKFRSEVESVETLAFWSLRNAGFGVTAAVYESAPSVLLGGFADMSTLEQRIGQRLWADATAGSGAWLRTTGNWTDVTQDNSTAGTSYEQAAFGLQAGYDLAPIVGAGGEWVLGVTGQYGQVNTDVSNAFGTGRIESDGYGLGATATWYGNSGTYVDLQGQLNWIDSDFSTAGGTTMRDGLSSTAHTLSVEIGHRYAMSATSTLIPQAQLTWGNLDGSSFTDAQGNAVAWGSYNSLTGRIGLAYEYTGAGLSGGATADTSDPKQKIYVIGNLLQDFSDTTSVTLNSSTLTAQNKATWAEIGIGGSIRWNDNTTLYTEANYSTELGSAAGTNEALSISAGFRFQF